MTRFHVPGLSIAVVRDFEISRVEAFGIADVSAGANVIDETLFQAASISKAVCAMAVLKAVQDRVFGLDDDINRILQSWRLPESKHTGSRAITPRMLLSHTAGLGDGFGFPGYGPGDNLPTTKQILTGEDPSNIGPVLIERPPFEIMKYSGGGTMIMQLALEDAVGIAFGDYVLEQVFTPIGMEQSTFSQPLSTDLDVRSARAHDGTGQPMDAKWHAYPELAVAGLWTTPTDLAKLLIEVQKSALGESNQVLNKSLANELIEPVGIGNYAVGFETEGSFFGHGGTNRGFTCNMHGHKQNGYGMATMTNSWSEGCNKLIREVTEIISRRV